MNYSDLTNILARLAGILIVAFAFLNIPVYFLDYYGLQIDSVSAFLGITAIPFLITVIAGAFLFLVPSIITNKLISNGSGTNNIEQLPMLLAGLGVLGAYLLCIGISDLVYLITLYYLPNDATGGIFTLDRWADLTAVITQIALGIILLFKNTLVVKLLNISGTAND
ncbi:MAG: hypothetical protein KAT90_06170 [Gammaproteobacteria bacterium]|nr:hypothetical protein [Gammaproteobacteria bacterium]